MFAKDGSMPNAWSISWCPFSVNSKRPRNGLRNLRKRSVAAQQSWTNPFPFRRAVAAVSKPRTRSSRPSEPNPFFPKVSLPRRANSPLFGRCGDWKTAGQCRSLTKSIAAPQNHYGKIPGVRGRSEFGLEIVTEIAYLVYIVGLSFDKVCMLLNFFQNLRLRKAQADALLYQLSRHWEQEFDGLCLLLAHSLVVHADETRWSLHGVWAFLSEQARLLLFGVPKDADMLKRVLDPASFAGILISDDAAVYANFSAAQKCWAHLLRKAIKLTRQDPNHVEYRDLTDRLLEIYHQACRGQRGQRLGDAGRTRKVTALEDEIFNLCGGIWLADLAPLEGHENDYRLLMNELMRLALAQELFTFVTAQPVQQPNGTSTPVAGTNNEAERTPRGAAQARTTGRTSKTNDGARRQTILTSVLESLRLYLKTFTLASLLEEMKQWWVTGQRCFTKQLQKLNLAVPETSILDPVLPVLPSPSG
jgi:transposase